MSAVDPANTIPRLKRADGDRTYCNEKETSEREFGTQLLWNSLSRSFLFQ